jgi:hypothetical protein
MPQMSLDRVTLLSRQLQLATVVTTIAMATTSLPTTFVKVIIPQRNITAVNSFLTQRYHHRPTYTHLKIKPSPTSETLTHWKTKAAARQSTKATTKQATKEKKCHHHLLSALWHCRALHPPRDRHQIASPTQVATTHRTCTSTQATVSARNTLSAPAVCTFAHPLLDQKGQSVRPTGRKTKTYINTSISKATLRKTEATEWRSIETSTEQSCETNCDTYGTSG